MLNFLDYIEPYNYSPYIIHHFDTPEPIEMGGDVIPCVQKLAPISVVVLQNVTNKSCLVYVKSEKYAFWVTLLALGSMR